VVIDQAYRGAFLYLIRVADVAEVLVDGARPSRLLRSFAIVRAYHQLVNMGIEGKGGLTHGSEVKIAPWALASASAAWVASSCAPLNLANSLVEIAYA
jgi:hypothetical protein